MKTATTTQRLWFYRLLTLSVTALLVHLLAIWGAPHAIMWGLMQGPPARAGAWSATGRAIWMT